MCVCAVGVCACVQWEYVHVCSGSVCMCAVGVCAVGVCACVQWECACVQWECAGWSVCVCAVGVCACVQWECVHVCSGSVSISIMLMVFRACM